MSFAVIDFETTGLVPERGDRVVEVGIVLVDLEGQKESEWTTLINPGRDVGASHIHGLTAADLLDAPPFADVADYILELLAGRVVVAHNASFDMRFLHNELQRANYAVTERPAALCSRKWGGRITGAAKLVHCCEALGISLEGAHSAIGDARATAQLLSYLLAACCSFDEWLSELKRCATYPWPSRIRETVSAVAVLRGQTAADPYIWLRSVLGAAWIPATPEDEASYLLMLDNALLDRVISRTEGQQLVSAAQAGGLSRSTVIRLHHDYLRSIATEALEDGVVTDAERADLEMVAAALGFGAPYVEEALAWATAASADSRRTAGFALRPGDRVVFTGDMKRERSEWVARICAAGLSSGGITKSTRLVVAADPDSLSSKAAKARSYGIPVVGEDAFERMFNDFCGAVSAH